MIYLLLSFSIGVGGGMFKVYGNNIGNASFGQKVNVFCDFEFVPQLVYSLNIETGKADASTSSFAYQYIQQEDSTVIIPISGILGDKYEYLHGNLSIDWYFINTPIKPYVRAKLGMMRWRFKSDGEVTSSLNGNQFDRYSLTLGGGLGLSAELSGFVFSAGADGDFIFSMDKDWNEGFGTEDENEYTMGFEIKIAKEF